MRKYALLYGMIVSVLLVGFIIVEILNIPILIDPTSYMAEELWWAGFIGVGLLVVDVFIPVPSSLVMIAHGSLFGVVGGTTLSIIGGLGAALLGFMVGRRSRPLLERYIDAEEQSQINQLLNRWGWLAILVTRPIPLVAETTVIVAGASSMHWRSLLAASALGLLPLSILYAITGAFALKLGT